MKNIETPKWDYFVTGRSKKTGRYSLVYACGTRERGEQILEEAKKEERLLEKYDDFHLERIEYGNGIPKVTIIY